MKRHLPHRCPLLKGQGEMGNKPVISPLSGHPEINYDGVM